MRHRVRQYKLNRTTSHRKALHRNLAQSLIEHGRVTTTAPKACDLRPFFDKLVTLAVKVRKLRASNDDVGALRARRSIHRLLGDRSLVPAEYQDTYTGMSDAARARTMRMASGRRHRTGEPKGRLTFTGESVTHRLIEKVAARLEDRPGGYTRLIRLAKRRLGDNAPLAMVQIVGDEEAPTSLTKPRASTRKRQADARYAMAIQLAKGWGSKTRHPVTEPSPEVDVEPEAEANEEPHSDD